MIANPAKIDLAALRRALTQAERDHGWAASEIVETTPDDDCPLDLSSRPDLVVAAGGDGTIRLSAGRLSGTGVPLGIIAAGTGNLLARNLGIDPTAPLERSLDIAFGGRDRALDFGVATVERPGGETERLPFAVIAGIGLDAGMIERTDEALKARIGWIAYLSGIARTMRGGGAFRARYRLGGGRTFGVRAAGLMVGNCGVLQAGFVLMPDAEPDDGLLDLLVLRPRGPLGWPEVLAGLVAGSLSRRAPSRLARKRHRAVHDAVRTLTYVQGESVVFRVDSKPEPFQVDGDAVGEIVAARVDLEPGALLVRVPRSIRVTEGEERRVPAEELPATPPQAGRSLEAQRPPHPESTD